MLAHSNKGKLKTRPAEQGRQWHIPMQELELIYSLII